MRVPQVSKVFEQQATLHGNNLIFNVVIYTVHDGAPTSRYETAYMVPITNWPRMFIRIEKARNIALAALFKRAFPV